MKQPSRPEGSLPWMLQLAPEEGAAEISAALPRGAGKPNTKRFMSRPCAVRPMRTTRTRGLAATNLAVHSISAS
jgi:hypothetical protein